MPDVYYSPQARRDLKRLEQKVTNRIRSKLRQAADEPASFGKNIERLTGRRGFRLRVADWRVIFDWDAERNIIVHGVMARDKVYKRR